MNEYLNGTIFRKLEFSVSQLVGFDPKVGRETVLSGSRSGRPKERHQQKV